MTTTTDTMPRMRGMKCKGYEPERLEGFGSILVEPKFDGIRVHISVDLQTNKVEFYSRGGNDFPSIAFMASEVRDIARCLPLNWNHSQIYFDAEVVSGTFNDTASQVRKKYKEAKDARLMMFDVVTRWDLDAGKSHHNLIERKSALYYAIAANKRNYVEYVSHTVVATIHQIDELYEEAIDKGQEGLIVKNGASHYKFGDRSKHWLKIKAHDTLDLPIVDVIEGGGKFKGMMGALVVKCGSIRVNVGTGFSDECRAEVWERYTCDPRLIIGRLIEIGYQYKTPAGSLRHPAFIRFRDDK